VNVDVTAPGATIALGLMFLKSNNTTVAARLSIPDTHFLLEHVRPDFVLLRVLSHSLVMWDSVRPEEDWLNAQIPQFLQQYHADPTQADEDLDHEALRQAHANIIAGSCLAIGLRFAGTADADAHKLMKKYVLYFGKARDETGGTWTSRDRPTLETCLDIAALALGLVMAGTGDLDAMRVLRAQRRRMDAAVTYGTHTAMHMAIGFLFLGGGRYTLSRSNNAIAALVCSLYPRFSLNTTANRYYLQAFRHLYVLAVQPRSIRVVDVDTREPCNVPLQIVLSKAMASQETTHKSKHSDTLTLSPPYLLPDYHLIKQISIRSDRYWARTIVVTDSSSVPQTVYVKRKPGFLPYHVDPTGLWSIAGRALSQPLIVPQQDMMGKSWASILKHHGSDIEVQTFVQHVCDPAVAVPSDQAHLFSNALRDCLLHEKIQILPVFLCLQQILHNLKEGVSSDTHSIWDVQMLITYINGPVAKQHTFTTKHKAECQILSNDLASLLQSRFNQYFDAKGLPSIKDHFTTYVRTGQFPERKEDANTLRSFLAFYGIPDLMALQAAQTQYSQMISKVPSNINTVAMMGVLLPHISTAALCKISSNLF